MIFKLWTCNWLSKFVFCNKSPLNAGEGEIWCIASGTFKDMLFILNTYMRRAKKVPDGMLGYTVAILDCWQVLIPEWIQGTKSLQLSKQDVEKKTLSLQKYWWGNSRSEFIKVWLQAAEWKLEWQHFLDSAWNGTREKDSRCSQLHLCFIDTDCICPPPGLLGRIYCTYAAPEIFVITLHFK